MFLLQMTMYKAIQGEKLTEQSTAADAQQPALLRRFGSWARLSASVQPRSRRDRSAASRGQR